jgi:hypothetical protein
MARSVLCVTGCGASVRLSNGDTEGTCGGCRAEAARRARVADEGRQRRALRRLARQGVVPRKLLQQVLR